MPDNPVAVRLDAANACLWRGAEAIRLTPQAWAVLEVLVAQAGQLVTKETLLASAWPETVVSEAALVVCIRAIRQVLGDTARTPQYVETVHRRGYRFIGPLAPPEAAPDPPQAVPAPAGAPPAALGREAELRTLHGWLAQAQGGTRCVGFVTGEAGIGKTTLVDAFVTQAAATGPLWLARGQCIEHYGAGEAYLPVLEALGQLCRGPEAAPVLALLAQQAPLWLRQMPALLSAPAQEALHRQVQGATPERMLRECAEAVEALTAERPLVLVLEDLQWSDQATLALVAYLAQRRAPARLLLLGTYRPVDVIVHRHPLQAVHQELIMHGQCVDVHLEALPAAAVAAVVAARLPGAAVPPAVVETLHRRTDGHPLFLVQVVDALLRQGALVAEAGRWALPGGLAALDAVVPESLRQLIEQQFDGLRADEQRALEAASVVGLDWPVAAVAAGGAAEAEQVEAWCAALARQGQFVQAGGLVEWPDGTVSESYQFRHMLYQQVVYDRVPVGRRLQLHRRIGARLAAGYQEQAEALLSLATRQGFPLFVGCGTSWRGWVLARQGQGEVGLAQLRQGLAAVVATGQELMRPYCLVLLAEAAGQVDQVEEGLHLLAEAVGVLEAHEQGDLRSEAYRLRGALLLRQATPDAAQAEACFQQALAVARRQQAKSWELRAAMNLARLWQRQGKRDDARALLAPIYGWFTEGFDTADLQEAKALLEDLGA